MVLSEFLKKTVEPMCSKLGRRVPWAKSPRYYVLIYDPLLHSPKGPDWPSWVIYELFPHNNLEHLDRPFCNFNQCSAMCLGGTLLFFDRIQKQLGGRGHNRENWPILVVFQSLHWSLNFLLLSFVFCKIKYIEHCNYYLYYF